MNLTLSFKRVRKIPCRDCGKDVHCPNKGCAVMDFVAALRKPDRPTRNLPSTARALYRGTTIQIH
jgi:hypothetical protein